MPIDLQPFCGTATEPRINLRTPFRLPNGAGIAASNGHIIAIIPDDGRDGVENCSPAIYENIAKLVAPFDDACIVQLDTMTLEPPQQCIECEGKGYKRCKACPECDGDGSFWHGSHEYDCKECDGLGEVGEVGHCADDAPKQHCSRCNGTGIKFATQCVNDAKFQTRYLALLQTLPGCKLSVRDKNRAARFEFDGGYGWLMPVMQ
jgi:hypothetical protein